MKKPLIVIIICALMLGTATCYFIAASFGERLEGVNHEAKAVKETGHVNLEGNPTHEAAEKGPAAANIQQGSNNESAVVVPGIQGNNKATETNNEGRTGIEQQQQKEATDRVNGLTENTISGTESGNESAKRSLEFPLFLTAGIAYAIVGLWIIMEKSITKIPYFITILGSLLLISLYILSHTVGFPLIGLEQIGPLDLTVAVLQAGIVTCCGYVLISLPKVIAQSTERSSIV
jgi:hypothetical protein